MRRSPSFDQLRPINNIWSAGPVKPAKHRCSKQLLSTQLFNQYCHQQEMRRAIQRISTAIVKTDSGILAAAPLAQVDENAGLLRHRLAHP